MRLPQFRFSLLGLMALVAFVGIGCAALRARNEWWASSIFTLALLLQMTALTGVLLLRDRARAAWVGVLVFGGGYLLVTSGVWPNANLITSRGLAWLERVIHGDLLTTDVVMTTAPLTTTYSNTDVLMASRFLWLDSATGRSAGASAQSPFLHIGQALVSMLMSLLGATVAAWIYKAGRARECEMAA